MHVCCLQVWSAHSGGWLPPMKLSVGRKKLTAVGLGDVAIFAGGFTSDVGSNNCGDRARPGMGCYRREVDLSGNPFHIYFDHLSRIHRPCTTCHCRAMCPTYPLNR